MITRVLVLAGGKGKRMNLGTAKVLVPFAGKPIIKHLLDAIESSGIDHAPVIVVGFDAESVKRTLGDRYTYVLQNEQLGTGHAVQCAEPELRGNADAILVLYGDHPFVSSATIRALHELHRRERPAITMATVTVPDFEEWRAPLNDFGRIVRDAHGDIYAIVEKKDASPEILQVREVNPSFFCFDANWLWQHLAELTPHNAQGEFYLTDLVGIAIQSRDRIASLAVDVKECVGVNTPEHLAFAHELRGSVL